MKATNMFGGFEIIYCALSPNVIICSYSPFLLHLGFLWCYSNILALTTWKKCQFGGLVRRIGSQSEEDDWSTLPEVQPLRRFDLEFYKPGVWLGKTSMSGRSLRTTTTSWTLLLDWMRRCDCSRYLPQVHQVGNLVFIAVPVFTVVLQDEVLTKKKKKPPRSAFLFGLSVRGVTWPHLRDLPAEQDRRQHTINVQPGHLRGCFHTHAQLIDQFAAQLLAGFWLSLNSCCSIGK